MESACYKSDLIVIHTEWNEFKFLNFKKLVKKSDAVVENFRPLVMSLTISFMWVEAMI